jgi:CubicO group peptidase (beta-lactamase class C family)
MMTTAAPEAVSMDPAGLKAVADLFHAQIKEKRLHPGAALAVYRRGKLVLDLWGGLADNQLGVPVEQDTMFVLFSSTKPLASLSVLKLVERGQCSLDDTVDQHWPGFGRNGKERVTIRHVLTHKGGFPQTPEALTWEKWRDWDSVVAAMEEATAQFEPGTTSAYHALNHGWVCAEIVRRVDGRPFPRFLREEITGPLGMDDTHVGLPPELEPRVAKLHAMEDVEQPGTVRTFNRPEVHQAVVPAGCGIATARDLARFYACLVNGGELDGVRIIEERTIRMATEIAVDGEIDRSLGQPIRRGTGFNLGGLPPSGDGPSRDMAGFMRMGRRAAASTFGHGGAGTSICWADWELGVAMVYIPNGFRGGTSLPNLMVERCADISDAVRSACR